MVLVKTSISIPEWLLKEVKRISPNVSSLVVKALEEYIQSLKVEKAKESFGKWESGDKESVDIINELRKENERNFTKSDY